MKKDIEAYIHACETCQRTKSSSQAKAAPLHPNEILSRPWTHISVDMVTGLPKSNGHDAILMIVDRFSKEIIPITCSTELTSEGWAKILRDEVYTKHGEETLCAQARNATASKTLITLTPNTTRTNPQVRGGF